MGTHLAVVELAHISGLAEDKCANTFAIETPPAWDPVANIDDIRTPLINFYNSGANSIASHLSPGISRAADATVIKVYDLAGHLDGSPHGSPVASGTFTLGPSGNGNALPEEVAAVLTLRAEGWAEALVETPDGADPGSAVDRPRQRRSGRLFIGPLNLAAITTVAGKARPTSFLRDTMNERAQNLQLELFAALTPGYLCVWSRQDGVFRRVTHAQVDDAWDTQRRRGVAQTLRTTVATPSV